MQIPVLVAAAATALLLAGRHSDAQQVRSATRVDIVPRADHHQHVVGPAAVASIAPAPTPPRIALPADLERLIQERERASGTNDISVYTPDAQILDVSEGEDHWVRGSEGLTRMIAAYQPETPFVPISYQVDASSGFIAGVVGRNPAKPTMHFMFGLKKNDAGVWRIAVEYATLKPPLEFGNPLTADKTIQVLDDAGISRAAVLSVAYWFGDGGFRGSMAQEYAKVREENDWMAAQIARFPARLVGFCGVNPLRAYAIEEARRCAGLPGVKGMKVHFGNSGVDVTRRDDVEKLRRFFREANNNRMAIIAHLWVDRSYGPEHTRIFVTEILPEAPDVVVQVAHLGGAGRYVYDSVTAVFVEAIKSDDRNLKNVYFDLATVVTDAQPQATLDLIASRMRQLGLHRILFGADTPAGNRPDPIVAWATIRRRLPLTERELTLVAANVAPYLR